MPSTLSTSLHDTTPPFGILSKLEEMLTGRSVESSNAERFPLATAIAMVQKYVHAPAGSDTLAGDALFRTELPPAAKTFVCAYFCRMMIARPAIFEAQPTFLPRLMGQLAQVAPRELFNTIGVAPKAQTFELTAAISTYLPTLEKDLSLTISAFRDLNAFGAFRQAFFQRFRPKPAQFFLQPFFPQSIAVDVRVAELFANVDLYLQETGALKMHRFDKVREDLEEFRRDTLNYPTRYSREYLSAVAGRLLELIQADYENSPYAKPGEIEIFGTEKRYPFSEVGARFNIAFILRNKGPGQVSDLHLEIMDVSGATLMTPNIFLGDVPPGERSIEFPAQVIKSVSEALAVGRVGWRQFDGTNCTQDIIIPLQSQKCDLDWVAVAEQEPYELEPVVTEKRLVGRRAILERLLAHARATSVASSLIIGQKRVGKTSIVRTLQSTGEREIADAAFIYLESGDYINPDPERTVAGLGECLCRSIQDRCPGLHGVETPKFENSLSPLVKFLGDVSKMLPKQRFVFILDEFDELPLGLYKRSHVGDALFLTIRSISGKPFYGFVLVGSEKLNLILSYQGERLNKFAQFNIDYFDHEHEWSSYCELVRKPVEGWLEIDDAAVLLAYKQSAGNPFFTKLICRELFKLMVTRRDRHVTEREMEEATSLTVNAASGVNFQHFWDDGIFETGDKKEEISLKRRKLLMAFADSVRPDGAVGRNDLLNAAQAYGIDNVSFDEYLHEFQTRHVWILNEGFISCKVPLFSRWLKISGVKSIITTISDPEAAIAARRQAEGLRVGSHEIVALVGQWLVYKGSPITEDKVRAWLSQFGADVRKQRLMFRLLQRLRFYNGATIRSKMREGYSRIPSGPILTRDRQKRSDILLSYIDGPGKSGAHYARTFADENGIYYGNIVEPSGIRERLIEGISTLLFVDDFIGGGGTAAKGLQKTLSPIVDVLRQRGCHVILFAICGFDKARSVVEKAAAQFDCDFRLMFGDVLTDADRAFDEAASVYDNSTDRVDAKSLAYAAGRKLEPRCPLGYGECQALVVFDSSCPNNSLPILWSRSNDWTPLFRRN